VSSVEMWRYMQPHLLHEFRSCCAVHVVWRMAHRRYGLEGSRYTEMAVACCVMRAACCMLHVAGCMLPVAGCRPYGALLAAAGCFFSSLSLLWIEISTAASGSSTCHTTHTCHTTPAVT
jgi:hypothetical protein